MKNKSDHDVSVWIEKSEGEDQYRVDVRDDIGNVAAETEHGKKQNGHFDPSALKPQDLIGSGGCVTLNPGKTIIHSVNVSKLYDVSKPGKYTIVVQKPDPEGMEMVKSNTITVSVTP